MKYIILSILFLSVNFTALAQKDSSSQIAYSAGYKFREGFFLSLEQVKNNSPLIKEKIISKINSNDPDFYTKALSEKTLSYFDANGIKTDVTVSSIWGYSKNCALYINWNDEFNRIPVIGSVCHFIGSEIVINDSRSDIFYDPYSMAMPSNYATKEMRQFLFDFETGKIMDYTVQSISVILMRDTQLFDEFNAIKGSKKKQMLFYYLRKYNEKHPLMLSKN